MRFNQLNHCFIENVFQNHEKRICIVRENNSSLAITKKKKKIKIQSFQLYFENQQLTIQVDGLLSSKVFCEALQLDI